MEAAAAAAALHDECGQCVSSSRAFLQVLRIGSYFLEAAQTQPELKIPVGRMGWAAWAPDDTVAVAAAADAGGSARKTPNYTHLAKFWYRRMTGPSSGCALDSDCSGSGARRCAGEAAPAAAGARVPWRVAVMQDRSAAWHLLR